MVRDLLSNSIIAVISFVLGLFLRWVWRWARDVRPAHTVWRLQAKSELSVVAADVEYGSAQGMTGGPIATIHPAEFAAASELVSFASRVFRSRISRVVPASLFPRDSALRGNLIILGGPIHNEVFRLIEGHLHSPFNFAGRSIRDESCVPPRIYEPEYNPAGELTHDVGLIICSHNPLDTSSRIIILAGCRTFACLGASYAMTGATLRALAQSIRRNRGDGSHCFIIRVAVAGGAIGGVEVLAHHSWRSG